MPQDIITLVILAVTVVMIVSLITDCVKDGHRTEERILIRKESMLRRKIEAKEKKRAEKLPLQNEAGQEESADDNKESQLKLPETYITTKPKWRIN